MKKPIDPKIPMWQIEGSNKIKKFAREIVEISSELRVMEYKLKHLNQDIEVYNTRINIYLSNIFGKPNFKHNEHVISVKENFSIHVYSKKKFVANNSSTDNLEPEFTIQSNKKKVNKIIGILYDYNDLIDDFDDLLVDYEEAAENHKDIWDEVKLSLKVSKHLKISKLKQSQKTNDIEEFSEENHLLVIIMDGEDDWNFRYIRREDEEKFNKFVERETKRRMKSK